MRKLPLLGVSAALMVGSAVFAPSAEATQIVPLAFKTSYAAFSDCEFGKTPAQVAADNAAAGYLKYATCGNYQISSKETITGDIRNHSDPVDACNMTSGSLTNTVTVTKQQVHSVMTSRGVTVTTTGGGDWGVFKASLSAAVSYDQQVSDSTWYSTAVTNSVTAGAGSAAVLTMRPVILHTYGTVPATYWQKNPSTGSVYGSLRDISIERKDMLYHSDWSLWQVTRAEAWSCDVAPSGDTLAAGATLYRGDAIGNSSGYVLRNQGDGNLVYSHNGIACWASGTVNKGFWVYMQQDGNLVVVNTSNNPVWASNTSGSGNHLVLVDNRLEMRSGSNVRVWYQTCNS